MINYQYVSLEDFKEFSSKKPLYNYNVFNIIRNFNLINDQAIELLVIKLKDDKFLYSCYSDYCKKRNKLLSIISLFLSWSLNILGIIVVYSCSFNFTKTIFILSLCNLLNIIVSTILKLINFEKKIIHSELVALRLEKLQFKLEFQRFKLIGNNFESNTNDLIELYKNDYESIINESQIIIPLEYLLKYYRSETCQMIQQDVVKILEKY